VGKNKKNKRKKGSKHQVPQAASTAARPERIPRVSEDAEAWKASRPTWSFAHLDLVAPVGGWMHIRFDQLDELKGRFRNWETMTWNEILSAGRKQNHPIDVSKCIPAARARLRVLGLDDREQLMSLSVNSTARVIGIRDGTVFRIVWWDPDHQICPSQLKHT